MAEGDDVVGRMKWAARHYLWLVLLILATTTAVAVGLAVRDANRPPEYQAVSLVIASETAIKPDQLPRFGHAVFTSGAVAEKVIKRTGLMINRRQLIPDRVSLVPVQDTIAFEVSGRAASPQAAVDLTDAAATAFVEQLNLAGGTVGKFLIQDRARPPEQPLGGSVNPIVAGVLGLIAGLAAALGALGVVLLVRRPITSAAEAANHSGWPVLSTLRLPRGRHNGELRDVGGLVVLARRFAGGQGPATYVFHSCAGGEQARHRVESLVGAALRRIGRPTLHAALDDVDDTIDLPQPAGLEIMLLDGASLSHKSDVPAVAPEGARTILVVHEGCSLTALDEATDQFLRDDIAGILFTRLSRRRLILGRRWRSTRVQQAPALSDLTEGGISGAPGQKPAREWATVERNVQVARLSRDSEARERTLAKVRIGDAADEANQSPREDDRSTG